MDGRRKGGYVISRYLGKSRLHISIGGKLRINQAKVILFVLPPKKRKKVTIINDKTTNITIRET